MTGAISMINKDHIKKTVLEEFKKYMKENKLNLKEFSMERDVGSEQTDLLATIANSLEIMIDKLDDLDVSTDTLTAALSGITAAEVDILQRQAGRFAQIPGKPMKTDPQTS